MNAWNPGTSLIEETGFRFDGEGSESMLFDLAKRVLFARLLASHGEVSRYLEHTCRYLFDIRRPLAGL